MGVFIFIIGLVFGSFYNVVGLRLPNNESIVKPGSHCPKCHHKLPFYENIPVISYIFLRGKCSSCHQRISPIYPAMEILTGVLFLFSYLLFGLTENFFISLIISSLVVIIFVSDSKYMVISDSPLVVATILIFALKWYYEGMNKAIYSLGYGLIIFLAMYLLMLLGNKIFKKESLGGGDIKLSFIAGMTLGPFLGLFYIILASFLAFPYAVYISIKDKNGMLPFGPFLVSSLLIINYNTELISAFLKTLLGLK